MRCPAHTISQSDFHPVIRPFSPLRLGRSYRLAPEPDGSPLFALLPLVACWRYEPREHLRPLAIARAAIPPSPLRDRVGYSDHDRFRGYVPVHCRSGLQPPCLRFATAVTGRHARLGSRLLARLCRGRHRRRQTSTRLQGATRTDPYGPNSGIRLVWGFHCQGGVTPFWSSFAFHSFVRPAPRAFFRPDRIFPSPSRAAAVKDGASSAPPKACP